MTDRGRTTPDRPLRVVGQAERRRGHGEGCVFRPTYRDKITGARRRVGIWYIRYRDAAGEQHQECTGSRDRRVATRLLTERLHALRQGEAAGPRIEKTTFDELAGMIRNDYVVNGRRSVKRVGESLAHLTEHFGGQRIVAITEDRILRYSRQRLEEGAKNATVNRELACLKRMLRLGARARKVGRIPYIAMLEERNRRKGFFEPEQFQAVLEHLPADLQPMIQMAYITGWRVASEIVPLQWSNVDFTNGLVRLEDSKNGEPREFYFTPELEDILTRQRQRTEELQRESGRLIPNVFWRLRGPGVSQDGRPVGYFRKPWLTACLKAGLGKRILDDKGRCVKIVAYRIPHDSAGRRSGTSSCQAFPGRSQWRWSGTRQRRSIGATRSWTPAQCATGRRSWPPSTGSRPGRVESWPRSAPNVRRRPAGEAPGAITWS